MVGVVGGRIDPNYKPEVEKLKDSPEGARERDRVNLVLI